MVGKVNIGLETDHRGMNKFVSREDQNYQRVLSQIKRLLIESAGTIPKAPFIGTSISFAIPFSLPNLQRNSGFVGREFLLQSLKQAMEVGKDILNIIILHGTGGMRKTQLALEYFYQSYKDYTSVFWINTASQETIILGKQRLIKHHARLSGDYSHIGRLLDMAGKLDSKGCFSVVQPPEARGVVEAVRQRFIASENTNLLLVFDNFDDLQSFDIDDYIPSCGHGTVIIKSRRPECIKQGRRGFEGYQVQPSESIKVLMTSAVLKYEDLTPDGK